MKHSCTIWWCQDYSWSNARRLQNRSRLYMDLWLHL